MTLRSALYAGEVVHERYKPKTHHLRYSVFSMLFDLEELPLIRAHTRIFGYNSWALLAFWDADHGPRDGTALRPWAEGRMREAGIAPDGGRIEILCYPRIFGYVFNPLSVYFCYRRSGTLAAVLYEVHNTHGEQHTYAIAATGEDGAVIRQSAEKAFYVSPFIGPKATYDFRIVPPADTVSIVIRQETGGTLMMAASFQGTRKPLTAGTLAHHLGAFPLMTFKVIAAIHWEAFKLWWKGFEVFPHRPQDSPPSNPRTRP